MSAGTRRIAAGATLAGAAAVLLLYAARPAASGEGAAAPTVVKVTAGKPSEFAFTLSRVTAVPAGTVVFQVTNRGALAHGFKVCTAPVASSRANACLGASTGVIRPGGTVKLKVTLAKAGKYEFLAMAAAEAAKGMKGLVAVAAAPLKPPAPVTTPAVTVPPANSTPAVTTPSTTTTTTSPPAAGNAGNGEALFTSEGCTGCHTFTEVRAFGSVGANLNLTHPVPFPHGQLTPSQLADLAAYINR